MAEVTIADLLFSYEQSLRCAFVDSPRLCAEMIIGEGANMGRAQLIAFGERVLSLEQTATCEAMLKRRVRGEPMAYILERKEFYGRVFKVTPSVLIPRPETELIVDLALEHFSRQAEISFADLGCGSGAILGSLLAEAPAWAGVGVDISNDALQICAENLKYLRVVNRARLLNADFAYASILPEADFDLIVSNPPYIPTSEYEELGFEVKNFEPRLALDSGSDGLAHPRWVAALSAHALKPGGLLLMEIGAEQGKTALEIFASTERLTPAIWQHAEIIPDLSGKSRVALVRKA